MPKYLLSLDVSKVDFDLMKKQRELLVDLMHERPYHEWGEQEELLEGILNFLEYVEDQCGIKEEING